MARDPLGLFPQNTETVQSSGNGPGWIGTFLLVAAISAASVFGYRYYESHGSDGGKDDQKQEQVDTKKVSAKDTFVVIVEETGERTAFASSLYADADLWAGFEARGTKKVHWFDHDSPAIQPYLEDAKKAGLPTLMVITSSGKVALCVKCPETREAVMESVNKVML